jgi:hypothetical protein
MKDHYDEAMLEYWVLRKPPSIALARAVERTAAAARRTAVIATKERARAYAIRPRELDAIEDGLSGLSPKIMVSYLRTMHPDASRWFGFGAESSAINLRGAMLYARYSRAIQHQEKRLQVREFKAADPWPRRK